jgi:hypothetical protein
MHHFWKFKMLQLFEDLLQVYFNVEYIPVLKPITYTLGCVDPREMEIKRLDQKCS